MRILFGVLFGVGVALLVAGVHKYDLSFVIAGAILMYGMIMGGIGIELDERKRK